MLVLNGTISYDPKSRRFEQPLGQAFRCRRLGNGVYRFRRTDGGLPNVAVCLVQIAPPWCEEKVDGLMAICSTHGGFVSNCPSDSDDCKVARKVVSMNRWYTVMRLETGARGARDCFDVIVLRKPSMRKGARKDPEVRPADGAGFHVMILSSS